MKKLDKNYHKFLEDYWSYHHENISEIDEEIKDISKRVIVANTSSIEDNIFIRICPYINHDTRHTLRLLFLFRDNTTIMFNTKSKSKLLKTACQYLTTGVMF